MAARRPRAMADPEKMADIPMTPMIDIVFQLLIFFMLSMHFKEIEGKLLSQLPRDKGPAPSTAILPQLDEIRIYVCCDPEGDLAGHAKNKAKHDAALAAIEKREWAAGKNLKLNDECIVAVGTDSPRRLYETAVFGDKKVSNRAIYKAVAQKAKELYEMQPVFKDAAKRPPVILDADSAVPYEHVVGIVNACSEIGLENLEFVTSPRYQKKK